MNALVRSVVTITPSHTGAMVTIGGLHGATDAVREVLAIARGLGATATEAKQVWNSRMSLNRSADVAIVGDVAAVWAAIQTARGRTDTALPSSFTPCERPAGPTSDPTKREPGSGFTRAEHNRFRWRREALDR